MNLLKILLTKSNMNRRTTIKPRTNATAKTPKSATEKCEGSIFDEKIVLLVDNLSPKQVLLFFRRRAKFTAYLN